MLWTDTTGVMRTAHYARTVDGYDHINTLAIGSGWNSLREWTVGDITADGRDDIVGLRGSELWLWEGQGGAAFRAGRVVGHGWSQAHRLMIEPSQLTSQGPGCTAPPTVDCHLLATFSDGRMVSYQSRGGGKFAAGQLIGRGWSQMRHVAYTDAVVNGATDDYGILELVAQDATGQWLAYRAPTPRADGTPRFGSPTQVSGPDDDLRLIAP